MLANIFEEIFQIRVRFSHDFEGIRIIEKLLFHTMFRFQNTSYFIQNELYMLFKTGNKMQLITSVKQLIKKG